MVPKIKSRGSRDSEPGIAGDGGATPGKEGWHSLFCIYEIITFDFIQSDSNNVIYVFFKYESLLLLLIYSVADMYRFSHRIFHRDFSAKF